MTTKPENLMRDLVAIKQAAAALRENADDLTVPQIDALLPLVRACAAELIALRSTMDRVRTRRLESEDTAT